MRFRLHRKASLSPLPVALLFVLSGSSCPPACHPAPSNLRTPLALSSASGLEGGALRGISAFASSGCATLAPPEVPGDAVYSLEGGTAWLSDGATRTGPTWAPITAADAGLVGRNVNAVRCAGTRLYVATEKGLEWISTRDRSTGVFPPAGQGEVTAIHPLEGSRVLAGTATGRVLVCDVAVNSCVADAPLDPTFAGSSVGFATLPSGGIRFLTSRRLYSSTDGVAWSPVGDLPAGNYTRLVLAGGDLFVFGGTPSGILRSAGGTGTFGQVVPAVYSEATHTYQNVGVAGFAATADALYVLESTPPRLWSSANAGQTWTMGATLPGSYGSSLTATPGFLWASTGAGTLRSADRGATWHSYSVGLSNLALPAVSASNGLAVAGGPLSGVFLSRDDCKTFTKAGNLALADSVAVTLVRTDGTLFAGGFFLQRSTDGGNTWTKTNLPATSVRGLVDANGTLFASGSGIGVYRSTDGGATWAKAGTGQPASGPFGDLAANGSTLAVANGLAVARSADGGNSWTTGAAIPGALSVSGLAFAGNTLFAAINQGVPGIYRSADLGSTWTRSSAGLPDGAGIANVQSIGGTLYASGAKYSLSAFNGAWKSSDGGNTWTTAAAALEGANATGFAASGSNVCVGTNGNSVLLLPTAASQRRLVPVVLDVDTGATRYTTELFVANRGTSDARATFLYTASLGSGSGTVRDVLVRAGQQWVQADVVGFLRHSGLPIPTGGQQAGTLLVTLDGLSGAGVAGVVARTTADTLAPQPAGAAGLAYAAVDPDRDAAEALTVYGLRASSGDRSNLAVYNTTPAPVTFSVTAFSGEGSGASTVVSASTTLPGWGWTQFNRILDGAGFANGWVTVARTSAAGAFGTYGVINDNATNDGSFVEPAPPELRPLYLNVPVLVETSSFVSELVFANASEKPADFVIGYRESLTPGGAGNDAILLTVPPFTQRIVPNAIDWLRSQNFAVGPRGASYAGSVNLYVSSGGALGKLYAGARTGSPSPAGGQFGLFTGPAFAGDEATQAAWIYGLHADTNNRSNVAALNTAQDASAGSITLTLDVFDGDAAGVLRGTSTLTLAPGRWAQASGILAAAGVSNGWVRVTRTSGTAPWVAYGVVNDGGAPGQRTGDGAYVPMER